MARPKQKVDDEVINKAESDLKTLKDSDIALKLLTIINYGKYPGAEVAKFFHTSQRNIFRWIEKFKESGIEGLKPRDKGKPQELLNTEQKQQVEMWIIKSQDYKGNDVNWTLEKLSKSIKEYFGIEIKKSAISNNLKKLGIVRRRPRPVHHQADKERQADFKKN